MFVANILVVRLVTFTTSSVLICRSETNKPVTSDNLPSSPSNGRGRSKSRHRLHGVVKSSTSSPTSSPGRMLRSSPGSSVHKSAGKSDSRHTQSVGKSGRGDSAIVDPASGSNQLSGTFASAMRSRNYDSDNQTEATSNESGVVCSLDEVRSKRNMQASDICNRERRNYDSDDNGNSTTVGVRIGSPSLSSVHGLRGKPRRIKRVTSAGQSLEVLSSNKVDDSSLQVPPTASHGRMNKREVI
jgi:hypothetical protein